MTDKGNQLDAVSIKLGAALKEILSSFDTTDVNIQNFKNECKDSTIAIIAKLQERFPMQYTVVRIATSLSPHNMVRAKEKSFTCFNLLIEKVAKFKWMSPDKADEAKTKCLKSLTQNGFCSRIKSWHLMQPITVLTHSWVHSCMVRKNM